VKSPQLAMAVGIGYFLGRTKKMRLALMIAAAGVGGAPRQLLRQGIQRLGATPEISDLVGSARGELLDAARSAAMTAMASRVESLNSRLGAPGGRHRDEDETGDEDDTGDDTEDDVEEQGDYAEDEPDEEPGPARRRAPRAPTRARARTPAVRRAKR
jgi:hypothetical protein